MSLTWQRLGNLGEDMVRMSAHAGPLEFERNVETQVHLVLMSGHPAPWVVAPGVYEVHLIYRGYGNSFKWSVRATSGAEVSFTGSGTSTSTNHHHLGELTVESSGEVEVFATSTVSASGNRTSNMDYFATWLIPLPPAEVS